jgi:hypothetical protein
MRQSHTLTLTMVRRIGCGADLANVQREQEWLERVNTRDAQYKLTQKAKAYAKFKPRPKPVAYVEPERLPERAPVERPSKWQTVGRPGPLGARPKGWVSSYVNGSKVAGK